MLFPMGQVMMSQGVNYDYKEGLINPAFFLSRHRAGDWGVLDPEDKKANEYALANGERILSSYPVTGIEGEDKVWIITERDRSYTTILYPSEY